VKPENRRSILIVRAGGLLGLTLIVALQACAPAAAADAWTAFQDSTPFAYGTPLPKPVPGELDGVYVKLDESRPQWWKCLRCADYRVAGGIWKLQFDHGIMRIYYDVTGWRSLASFKVQDDRLLLFNDPHCPESTAEYRWSVEAGQLELELVEDACAFDLRGKNLTKQTWYACPTPAGVVADSAGLVPVGCQDPEAAPLVEVLPEAPLKVTVHGGDGRFFAQPPDLMVYANTEDTAAPEGVDISFDAGTIGYGLHRVLWWNGNWIEVSTELPFNAMGVQFLGEPLIGWARVLFDGQEVWSGNTSQIWTKSGRSGGYIEFSGFEPGHHTMRVESLDFDHRPVTLMGFGFSTSDGVEVQTP
jgi:hypothetical protein